MVGFITIAKRCRRLALIQLLWVTIIITCAQSQFFQNSSTSQQISFELYGSGPFPWSRDAPKLPNKDLFHLQLHGLNLDSVFPGATSGSKVIFKLHRLQAHEQSKLTDQTNVLVISKNGSHYLQDKANSLFRGTVQLVLSEKNVSTSTSYVHSEVLASGHINRSKRYVWLLAFIKLRDEYFYIRPYIGNSSSSSLSSSSSSSSTSNVHLISHTSDQYFDFFTLLTTSSSSSSSSSSSRSKRNTGQPKRCPMEINVDYSLFVRMERKQHSTIHFVQTVFSFANNIFLGTALRRMGQGGEEEEEVLEGYGNALCRVKIYEEPPEDEMSPLYNERGYWDADQLLYEKLGRQPHLNNFCLSYLFTDLRIIETRNQDLHGYAVVDGLYSLDRRQPKVGAVSFHDCPDPLDLHCMLAFAHELGHSWGARHDPASSECIPDRGGNYLMGSPFLYEKGPNNMVFSPCSVRDIYQAVTRISDAVFKSYCPQCGNGLVDPGEECDEGDQHLEKQCCTERCTLLENAQCSPFNHDCCTEHCKMANGGRLCRRADRLFCRAEARCSGTSLACPPAATVADGTVCSEGSGGGGICKAGFCTTSCPPDYEQCDCGGRPGTEEHLAFQCFMCCRPKKKEVSNQSCSHNVPRPTGFPCYVTLNETAFGACRAGYCEEIEMKPLLPPSDDDEEEGGRGLGFWVFTISTTIAITAVVLLLVALYLLRKHYPKRLADRVQHHLQQHQQQQERLSEELEEEDQQQRTFAVLYKVPVSEKQAKKNEEEEKEEEEKAAAYDDSEDRKCSEVPPVNNHNGNHGNGQLSHPD